MPTAIRESNDWFSGPEPTVGQEGMTKRRWRRRGQWELIFGVGGSAFRSLESRVPRPENNGEA